MRWMFVSEASSAFAALGSFISLPSVPRPSRIPRVNSPADAANACSSLYSCSSVISFPTVPLPARMSVTSFVISADALLRLLRDVGNAALWRYPAGTYPQSGIGVPLVDGVMSTALSPRSDTEPSEATEPLVIRWRIDLLTSIATSTCSPTKSSTLVTVPTSTPATRTGDPDLRPATLSKRVFRL